MASPPGRATTGPRANASDAVKGVPLWRSRRGVAALSIFVGLGALTFGMLVTAVSFALGQDGIGYALLTGVLFVSAVAAACGTIMVIRAVVVIVHAWGRQPDKAISP
jgi:hypothetical protein